MWPWPTATQRVPHDPAAWQVDFAAAGDGTADPDMERIRTMRKDVRRLR